MPKQKLTPWFPAHIKPVHIGVYQRGHDWQRSGFRYWYWNGNFWETGGWATAELAAEHKRTLLTSQPDLEWRGLISPIPTNQPQEKLL